jgi:hypothetical protein
VNELDSGKWDDKTKSVSPQYHPFHIAGEYYSINLHDLIISIGNQKVKWSYGVGDIFQAVKRSYKRQQQIDKMKVFNKQRDILKEWYEDTIEKKNIP